ncbi:polycystic kidney disease protein 1-like 1 [Tachyglossus aculeatus]|uniref:polycystic kidney disease protein 1-like 1 n=1 Tax=Tachyglossus aculeatus TaxID=9261 RepID=UPI0018F468E4|nr:polycystic kidney disease protein 1-like 1 [Tachyglossus aculeatus]
MRLNLIMTISLVANLTVPLSCHPLDSKMMKSQFHRGSITLTVPEASWCKLTIIPVEVDPQQEYVIILNFGDRKSQSTGSQQWTCPEKCFSTSLCCSVFSLQNHLSAVACDNMTVVFSNSIDDPAQSNQLPVEDSEIPRILSLPRNIKMGDPTNASISMKTGTHLTFLEHTTCPSTNYTFLDSIIRREPGKQNFSLSISSLLDHSFIVRIPDIRVGGAIAVKTYPVEVNQGILLLKANGEYATRDLGFRIHAFSENTASVMVDFGDGSPIICNNTEEETYEVEITAHHHYEKEGIYMIRVIAFNEFYRIEDELGPYYVEMAPEDLSVSVNSSSIQKDELILFTASQLNIIHKFSSVSTYNVTLIAWNRVGICQAWTLVTVLDGIQSVSVFTNGTVFATDTDITFFALTTETNPLEFLWYFGDRSPPERTTSRTITKRYSVPNSYQVLVNASDKISFITSDPHVVCIQRKIVPNRLVSRASVLINSSLNFECRINFGTNVTHLWNFGDGSVRPGKSTESHIYTREGEYTVEVLVVNKVSSASLSKQIFVVREPCQPPLLQNMGPGRIQIRRHETVTLQVTFAAAIMCNISQGLHYHWSLMKSNGFLMLLPPTIDNHKQTILLPRYFLDYGNYSAIAKVQIGGSVVYSNYTVQMEVLPSDLVSTISEGTHLFVSKTTSFIITLNGSESYDPDNPGARLQYYWKCAPASRQQQLCFNSSGEPPFNSSAPVISFPATLLDNTYDQFLVMLTVSSGHRISSEAQLFLSISSGPTLRSVHISWVSSKGNSGNWNEELSFKVTCEDCGQILDISYNWNLYLINATEPNDIEEEKLKLKSIPFCSTVDFLGTSVFLSQFLTVPQETPAVRAPKTDAASPGIQMIEPTPTSMPFSQRTSGKPFSEPAFLVEKSPGSVATSASTDSSSSLATGVHLILAADVPIENSSFSDAGDLMQFVLPYSDPGLIEEEFLGLRASQSERSSESVSAKYPLISKLHHLSLNINAYRMYRPRLIPGDLDTLVLKGSQVFKIYLKKLESESSAPKLNFDIYYENIKEAVEPPQGRQPAVDSSQVLSEHGHSFHPPEAEVEGGWGHKMKMLDRKISRYTNSISGPVINEETNSFPDEEEGYNLIDSYYSTDSAGSSLMVDWSKSPIDTDVFQSITSSGITSQRVTIKPFVLRGGEMYMIQASVASNHHLLGKAQLYFTVNEIPQGMTCEVQPSRGYEADTIFSVFCTSGKADFHYEFSYSIGNSSRIPLYRGRDIQYYFTLPAGEPLDDYRVTIFTEVTNGHGSKSQPCAVDVTVLPRFVRSTSSSSYSPKEDLYSSGLKNLSTLLLMGSYTEIRNYVTVLTRVLNRLYAEDRSIDPDQPSQIRSALISSVCNLPFQDQEELMDSVLMLTDLISTATQVTFSSAAQVIKYIKQFTNHNTFSGMFVLDKELTTKLVFLASGVLKISEQEESTHAEYLMSEGSKVITDVTLRYISMSEENQISISTGQVELQTTLHSTFESTKLTAGSTKFLLPNALARQVVPRSGLFKQCFISQLIYFRKNPYFWRRAPVQITGDAADLSLYNCTSRRKIDVRRLVNPVTVEFERKDTEGESISETPGKLGNNENRTIFSLSRDKTNFHQFSWLPKSSQESLQIIVEFSKPTSRTFPVLLLVRFSEKPTPLIFNVKQTHFWDHQVVQIFVPAVALKGPGSGYLSLLDADYNRKPQNKYLASVANYTVSVHGIQCLLWDIEREWKSGGCHPQQGTILGNINCSCNHLTTFTVVSRKLNTSLETAGVSQYRSTGKNIFPCMFLSSFGILYVVLAIVSKFTDVHEEKKKGYIFLQDNMPTDRQQYAIFVDTGFRSRAQLSAKVHIVLYGEDGLSETRELSCPEKLLFESNSRHTFILSIPESLGPLWKIHLWHNNSGPSPSWYVSRVIVKDLMTGARWVFPAECWLAADKGDGRVEREFTCLRRGLDFRKLLYSKFTEYLEEFHIWFSVYSHPSYSSFTQTQRLTVCFVLALGYVCFDALLTHLEPEELSPELGLIEISADTMMKGTLSTLIILPVALLLSFLFRFSERRISDHGFGGDQHKSLRGFQMHTSEGRNSHQWCQDLCKKDEGGVLNSLTPGIPSGSFSGRAERESGLTSERIPSGFEASHQPTQKWSHGHHPLYSSESRSTFRPPVPRRQMELPPWWRYVAWAICGLVSLTCLVITGLLGFGFGPSKCIIWLHLVFFSIVTCILVIQPFGILAVRQRTRHSRWARPPAPAQLKEAKERLRKETVIQETLKEFFLHTLMLFLLLFIILGSISKEEYFLNQAIRNEFTRNTQYTFGDVKDVDGWWNWSLATLLDSLYKDKWQNPSGPRTELNFLISCLLEEQFNIFQSGPNGGNCYLIGTAVLQRLKVPGDYACEIDGCTLVLETRWAADLLEGLGYKLLAQVSGQFSDDFEDQLLGYDPRVQPSNGTRDHEKRKMCQTGRSRLCGQVACYEGSSSAVTLGRTRTEAYSILTNLKRSSWLDTTAGAVAVQFVLYNPPTNLFTSVVLLVEFPSAGRLIPSLRVESVDIYRINSVSSYCVRVSELVFLGLMLLHLCSQLWIMNQKSILSYCQETWNWLEFSIIGLSFFLHVSQMYHFVLAVDVIDQLHKGFFQEFVDFSFIASWGQKARCLQGILSFFLLIKCIRLLGVHKPMASCSVMLWLSCSRITKTVTPEPNTCHLTTFFRMTFNTRVNVPMHVPGPAGSCQDSVSVATEDLTTHVSQLFSGLLLGQQKLWVFLRSETFTSNGKSPRRQRAMLTLPLEGLAARGQAQEASNSFELPFCRLPDASFDKPVNLSVPQFPHLEILQNGEIFLSLQLAAVLLTMAYSYLGRFLLLSNALVFDSLIGSIQTLLLDFLGILERETVLLFHKSNCYVTVCYYGTFLIVMFFLWDLMMRGVLTSFARDAKKSLRNKQLIRFEEVIAYLQEKMSSLLGLQSRTPGPSGTLECNTFYLDEVERLMDELLFRITALTNGLGASLPEQSHTDPEGGNDFLVPHTDRQHSSQAHGRSLLDSHNQAKSRSCVKRH